MNNPIPHHFYYNFKCHICQYLRNSDKIFIVSHFSNGLRNIHVHRLIEKEEVNSMNLSFLKRLKEQHCLLRINENVRVQRSQRRKSTRGSICG